MSEKMAALDVVHRRLAGAGLDDFCLVLYSHKANNNEKATVKIRREVDYGLNRLGKKVIRKGDFIYPAGYQTIPIRMPNRRKIQHISTEELAEATYRILQTCVGTTREALSAETTRVYGFSRAGQNILLAMSEAVELLIKTGRMEELEGKLRIKK